ncbi:Uridine-cytidine kinase-like [Dirofilaria immitis]
MDQPDDIGEHGGMNIHNIDSYFPKDNILTSLSNRRNNKDENRKGRKVGGVNARTFGLGSMEQNIAYLYSDSVCLLY